VSLPEPPVGSRGSVASATAAIRAIKLIRRPQRRVRTLTVDNRTEFHGHEHVEAATGARIRFATAHPLGML
jgi:IS30 family transposase